MANCTGRMAPAASATSWENGAFPADDLWGFHAQLRRHHPARPAVHAPDRAHNAGRAAGLRVRLDVRLARPLAGVDPAAGPPRQGDYADEARADGDEPRDARPDAAR